MGLRTYWVVATNVKDTERLETDWPEKARMKQVLKLLNCEMCPLNHTSISAISASVAGVASRGDKIPPTAASRVAAGVSSEASGVESAAF